MLLTVGVLSLSMFFTEAIDELIMNLPTSERAMVSHLRALIKECLPKATEKTYYDEGFPFYAHNRLICFIWPSSARMVPKRIQKSKAVTLGFCQGNRMSNEDGVLQSEGRKQVYVMYFHTLADIDDDQIRALLYEAEMIDETFSKKKRL
jgi:hypothetical protein